MDRKLAVGTRIKTMRMSRGMSQLDLAKALKCAQSTVAMYETGKRMPDMETVDFLADIFNVPPYAILYSENEIAVMIGDGKLPETMTPPRTIEARIVSGGMDKLPKEQREQILAVLRAMFANSPDLFKEDD